MLTKWTNPLPLALLCTRCSDSFKSMPNGATGLPLSGHPGAFGAVRQHHIHEGVDLYCPIGTEVRAVEAGRVVAVLPFTGPKANSPWWLDTEVVLVQGPSGVVAYGEIAAQVAVNQLVTAGAALGRVVQVLRRDKGRPMAMLHLELHHRDARQCPEWTLAKGRPVTLLDPTPYLFAIASGEADI